MKLAELRGLIRKTSGNVLVISDIGNGVKMTLALQKTPLLDELGEQFKNDRSAETGLAFDSSTNILFATTSAPAIEKSPGATPQNKSSAFDDGEDEEDLL